MHQHYSFRHDQQPTKPLWQMAQKKKLYIPYAELFSQRVDTIYSTVFSQIDIREKFKHLYL